MDNYSGIFLSSVPRDVFTSHVTFDQSFCIQSSSRNLVQYSPLRGPVSVLPEFDMALRVLRSGASHAPASPFTVIARPIHPKAFIPAHTQTRTFLPNLSSITPGPQTLTASRILPYPAYPIFSIISDISSYPTFLPLVTSAEVTSKSNPDAHYDRRWPQEATLQIGLKDMNISESFTSRVTCVPPVPGEIGRAGVGIVEAVSGTDMALADGQLVEGDTAHHTHAPTEPQNHAGPLALLRTRWQVREYPHKPAPAQGKAQEVSAPAAETHTEVTLSIEFKFNSMVYDVMSRAATPKIAESVVAAFERRVRKLLGGEGEAIGTGQPPSEKKH